MNQTTCKPLSRLETNLLTVKIHTDWQFELLTYARNAPNGFTLLEAHRQIGNRLSFIAERIRELVGIGLIRETNKRRKNQVVYKLKGVK